MRFEFGQTRLRVFITCLLLALLAGPLPAQETAELLNGRRFEFDSENFAILSIGPWIPAIGDEPAKGREIRFDFHRDGKYYGDFTVYELESHLKWLITHNLRQIRYRGKDGLWLVSRLGHRLDGAALIDIPKLLPVKRLAGKHFVISLDASHIAYSYPMDRARQAILIDDMMVFPEFVPQASFQNGVMPEWAGSREFYARTESSLEACFPLNGPYTNLTVWDKDGGFDCVARKRHKPEGGAPASEETVHLRIENTDRLLETRDAKLIQMTVLKSAEDWQPIVDRLTARAKAADGEDPGMTLP